MKKDNKKSKKLPSFKNGGNFGKNAEALGLFIADNALSEWAPNAIKQDQYDDTAFGRSLGKASSINESFSSQSPISKNVSKYWNDNKTGMSEDQMKAYNQVQPIAKTGSKIGEMWTGSAMGGVGGKGATGQFIQGTAQQGLNAQYDPTQNMQGNPNNSIYQFGGIAKQWGITPNAEVEKQENAIHPDGQFRQFDGPSHEDGGIQTHLPEGTKIFSDKLKMPKTGKTFAELNKANDTRKEDKIINNPNATSVEKATASLMKLAKQKSSDILFSTQEALKQAKVDSYTKRMGGIQKYPDGVVQQDPNKPVAGGYNLMANVKLNQDPTMIPQGVNIGGYNQFQKFLSSKDLVKDPRMNTNEGRKLYTDELINEFNTSDYVKKYPKNKITPESIKAVQEYHKKSDPNVVVDGWVGSQTSQMRYPTPNLSYQSKSPADKTPAYMDKPINVTWGNKQYTLPADKWNNYSTKDFVPVNRYGGVQKFKNGGESEEPSFGYTPDNLAGQYKLQQAYNNQKLYEESLAQYEDAMNKHNKYSSINPNNPYNPTFDFNMPVGGKLDQAILRDKNYSYKEDGMPANAGIPSEPNISKEDDKEDDPANSNWQNYLTQAALFTGNNLGNFYDLARASEVEQDKYGKLQPKLLDPTAALRTNKQVFRNVNESLKDAAGGHAGAYMSNRIASGAKESIASDDIRREYYNRNVGIENTAQQYNIEQQKAEDIANMLNRAKSRDIKGNAISNIGSNTVSQYKDSKMTKADMDKIELIKEMYPSIKNKPDLVAYYKKKYPSIKWDEIEKSNK